MESKVISHGNKRETYEQFVDKFKPKKTTDDCYTPPEVYEAVKEWAMDKFEIPEDAETIRPFWPGGDYRQVEYPEGCVVIDNPPFSILKEICNYYKERGIKYVLYKKAIFGGAALVSKRKAEEAKRKAEEAKRKVEEAKRKPIEWKLSDREETIVDKLGESDG